MPRLFQIAGTTRLIDIALCALHCQRGGGLTVELLVPGFAPILAVQYHPQMPYRPTLLGIDELHRRQADADRHLGLTPTFPRVVREQHDAALTDRHQTIPGPGQPEQYRAR